MTNFAMSDIVDDLHFNKLTPPQLERMALLAEELGEAVQVVGKIIRHGIDSHHPRKPELTNRTHLENELGDILHAMELLTDSNDLDIKSIEDFKHAKRRKAPKHLHHQD